MLVPSSFTGWYRNTMMNAEIPREISRSRTQADTKVAVRRGSSGLEIAVFARLVSCASSIAVQFYWIGCRQGRWRDRQLLAISP